MKYVVCNEAMLCAMYARNRGDNDERRDRVLHSYRDKYLTQKLDVNMKKIKRSNK